jgi:hypothetical protein
MATPAWKAGAPINKTTTTGPKNMKMKFETIAVLSAPENSRRD